MSDKFRAGINVIPVFNDGEQPPANKLNALGAQVKRAASQIEAALGDLHSDSWPYLGSTQSKLSPPTRRRDTTAALTSAETRALDIANIGRLIGPASLLNPAMLGRSQVVEDVPAGVREFSLRYIPEDRTAVTFSDNTVFASFVSDPSNIDNSPSGQYSVSTTGKVNTWTVTAGGTATYYTDPTKYAGGTNPQGARFNVLPDPNQISAGGNGVTITGPDGSGRYLLALPTVTHFVRDVDGDSITLGNPDINTGLALKLPLVLEEALVAGDVIPGGFLFLKNLTTGKVYGDSTYYWDTSTQCEIGGAGLTELADEVTAGNKFVLITIGSDICTSIEDLRTKSFHSHDRTFGEPFVDLSGISGFLADAAGCVPSKMSGNFAPQYLHRDGYDGSEGLGNDRNIMRGHLYTGYTAAADGSQSAGSGATFVLGMGWPESTSRSTIRRDGSNQTEYKNYSDHGHSFLGGVVNTEDGIAGEVGVTSIGVKFRVIELINVNLTGIDSGSVTANIDLDSYGLTGKIILGYNLLLRSSDGLYWFPIPGIGFGPGNNEFGTYYYVTDHTIRISGNSLTGTAWASQFDASGLHCKIVVMYN